VAGAWGACATSPQGGPGTSKTGLVRPCYDKVGLVEYTGARAMSTKDAVIEMIKRLPDDVTLPDIMAELTFRQQVDEGLRQLDAGEGLSHEDAKRQLSEWLT